MVFFIVLMSHLSNLETDKNISRKLFLKLVTFGVIALFVTLWNALLKQEKLRHSKPATLRIKIEDLAVGVHFIEDVIVVKLASEIIVFSSRCTHAGCKINHEINGRLVCPCHGSAFDASSGKVLNGPAGLPLKQIKFEKDIVYGEIVIIQTRL
jgi:Rieske Fe-S protein